MSNDQIELEVTLFDYWHAGSGRGRGPVVDAEVVRTPAGLPKLPGRTLKGLCREGVTQALDAGLIADPKIITRLFGGPECASGALAFGDATLGPAYERWAADQSNPAVVESLYVHLASTKVDTATGLAANKTLRTIEAVVPMTLTARVFITQVLDFEVTEALDAGLGFIRGLGSGRRRGLGRARISRKGAR